MRRGAAAVAAVIVVLETAVSAAVILAIGGTERWAWLVLALLVLITCGAVWWRERRQAAVGATPDVSIQARRRGAIRASPVHVRSAGGATVSVEADSDGLIEGSGVTVDDGGKQ